MLQASIRTSGKSPEGREYRRLLYEIDALKIDPWGLAWFLWGQYKPLSPELLGEEYRFLREAFKRCLDCQNVWFISAKRDKAWKFSPTDKTIIALSKSLSEFFEYVFNTTYEKFIKNNFIFIKSKTFIQKILEEDCDDTVFFDILFGEIVAHPREEYDWDTEWPYDKFHPLSRDYGFLFDEGSRFCRYCGKEFMPRRINYDTMSATNSCNSPECRKKRYIDNRRLDLSRKKESRIKSNIENPRTCLNCGGILHETARPNQKFCGLNCRVTYHRKKEGQPLLA